MKQRGRDRPFWDKGPGGGKAGERGGGGDRERSPGKRAPRESPGERAARAFEEGESRRGPGQPRRSQDARPPRGPQDARPPRDGDARRPQDARPPRGPQDARAPRDDLRPRDEEPRRRPDEFRRRPAEARPRREPARGERDERPRRGERPAPEEPRVRERSGRQDEWRGPREPRDGRHEQPREWPQEQAPERRQEQGPERPREGEGSLLFGLQPVLEALRAGQRPVERLTVVEGAHEARVHEILELARAARVPVRRAPRAELHRLAAGANHQGVVASVAAAPYAPAEELLDALAARVGTADQPLALLLDGVEDPRNLGAIIRTAECAGAHAVFVPERRAAGLTETAAKAAAGALEYVPVARATNLARLVEELKARGVWTVGTAADAEVLYTEWDWTQPCAVVLGGEGEGLRRLVRERCDVLVRIPLRGRIPSLNVSVAAAVLLYEALRQRTAGRGGT